ncbi:hypothetical protein LEP1GSC170_3242 [Leptospira interrogans serovar Bataviae str. HAI135]|nr:hypothetical protein LEP1GSC170_3242 [Leptospira interrogans serovar Bataviae str. HAI135]
MAYVRFKSKTVNSVWEIDSLFWNSKFLKSNSVVPDSTHLKKVLEKSFSSLSNTLEILNVSSEFGFPAVAVLLPIDDKICGLVFSASEFLGLFLALDKPIFFK